jgi:exodeoxyribonuclease V alpha subunit
VLFVLFVLFVIIPHVSRGADFATALSLSVCEQPRLMAYRWRCAAGRGVPAAWRGGLLAEEEITGTLKRVTFTSTSSSWSVARLQPDDSDEEIAIVGDLFDVSPGERLRLVGAFETSANYGRQFRFRGYTSLLPATVQGIERYLSSGLVPGIRKRMAKRLVAAFGAETLDVIENTPEKLEHVSGIGPKLAGRIRSAYEKGRSARDIMVYLHSHGVSPVFATKICKRYGDEAARVVQHEPYRLAADIPGIGFQSADRIAREVGIAKDSPARGAAGILHCLGESVADGHLFLPTDILLREAEKLLQMDRVVLERALQVLQMERHVTVETLPHDCAAGASEPGASGVYLARLRRAEVGIAALLRMRLDAPLPPRPEQEREIVAESRSALGVPLSEGQESAIARAVTSRILVVTGGPGTGKTTIVRGILTAYRRMGLQIALTAPTGRASRRLQEATGQEAKTLHRLLEFTPREGGYRRNAENPLSADAVIVDEVSMLDVPLCHALLKALRPDARLLLVGDAFQLPSVGPGAVLADLIQSGAVPVVRLTEIFRQSQESAIVRNAHRILQGRELEALDETAGSDFFFIEKEDPEDILDALRRVVGRRIPERFGLDPLGDVQVLAPMYRGLLGTDNLNHELQALLNPNGAPIPFGGARFRVGDKVMQIRNDYDKDVFNGDVGLVRDFDAALKTVTVAMEGRDVVYEAPDLSELVPAYAVTVHKSQGSEYPAVVVPLHTQHYMMLQRNLLYTAVTRGRRLVVLVGSRRAVRLAISNNEMTRRFTCLAARLRPAGETA